MKNQLFYLMMVFIAGSASSQVVQQGGLLLGGCVGYTSKTEEINIAGHDDENNTSYTFMANGVYFLSPNWGVGAYLELEGEKDEEDQSTYFTTEKTSKFMAGALVRYQYAFTERAACFSELSVGIGSGSVEQSFTYYPPLTLESQTIKDKFNSFGVNISPGILYQLKPRWAFDVRFGSIGYNVKTWHPDDTFDPDVQDYKVSSLKVHLNTKHIRIGASYVFGGEVTR